MDDLLYKKVLPLQKFYKLETKTTGDPPLRNGEYEDEYILENTCITSIMGDQEFTPVISIYLRYGSMHGSLDIYITEHQTHKFVKQFVIRSHPNNWKLSDLQKQYTEISNIITKSPTEACIKLVEYLTDENNKIIFEVYG